MDVMMTHVKSGNTFFVNSSLDKDNISKVNTALDHLPIPNNMPVVKPVKTTVYACLERSSTPYWVRVYAICGFFTIRRIVNMKGNQLTVKAIDKGYEFETTSADLHELEETIRAIPALVSLCFVYHCRLVSAFWLVSKYLLRVTGVLRAVIVLMILLMISVMHVWSFVIQPIVSLFSYIV